ncbi:MAG: glycosyltransferase family 2 protein [Pseudomonadota bacterium]
MSKPLLESITPLILTYNEAPNLARCLAKLGWAENVLVVDSGSTDETLEITRQHAHVRVVTRPFDNFANQCNFGLSQITSPWVLSLDADYELSSALVYELANLEEDPNGPAAYEAAFIYRIYGRPLRGTLYPSRKVLYLRERAKYRNEGHGHRVDVAGDVARLQGRIYHDDRKALSRWFGSQQNYAKAEAEFLLSVKPSELSRNDKIRRMIWVAPPVVFLYTLIVKGCIFDGWPGWFYVLQRTIAEAMIALELVDRKLR